MGAGKSFQQQPSQEVLNFLQEEMKLRFPLVKDRHPDTMTTRLQNGSIFIDVWSKDGQWIMASETPPSKLIQLEGIIANPELRAKSLEFFAQSIERRMK